jgi:hypothetical protein
MGQNRRAQDDGQMTIPRALLELTDVLRLNVELADASNWERLRRTAWDYVQAIRSYVDSPGTINDACIKTLAACRDFTHALKASSEARLADHIGVENAKQLALFSIDELQAALQGAEPSNTARILRLPW